MIKDCLVIRKLMKEAEHDGSPLILAPRKQKLKDLYGISDQDYIAIPYLKKERKSIMIFNIKCKKQIRCVLQPQLIGPHY